jgi:hypothetical protein
MPHHTTRFRKCNNSARYFGKYYYGTLRVTGRGYYQLCVKFALRLSKGYYQLPPGGGERRLLILWMVWPRASLHAYFLLVAGVAHHVPQDADRLRPVGFVDISGSQLLAARAAEGVGNTSGRMGSVAHSGVLSAPAGRFGLYPIIPPIFPVSRKGHDISESFLSPIIRWAWLVQAGTTINWRVSK